MSEEQKKTFDRLNLPSLEFVGQAELPPLGKKNFSKLIIDEEDLRATPTGVGGALPEQHDVRAPAIGGKFANIVIPKKKKKKSKKKRSPIPSEDGTVGEKLVPTALDNQTVDEVNVEIGDLSGRDTRILTTGTTTTGETSESGPINDGASLQAIKTNENGEEALPKLKDENRFSTRKRNKKAIKKTNYKATTYDVDDANAEDSEPNCWRKRGACIFAITILFLLLAALGAGLGYYFSIVDTAQALQFSDIPTISPTKFPTMFPTETPTKFPTMFPTLSPTTKPTKFPTLAPTNTPAPTKFPTASPTPQPTTIHPTNFPTQSPTQFPTTAAPTSFPTA